MDKDAIINAITEGRPVVERKNTRNIFCLDLFGNLTVVSMPGEEPARLATEEDFVEAVLYEDL